METQDLAALKPTAAYPKIYYSPRTRTKVEATTDQNGQDQSITPAKHSPGYAQAPSLDMKLPQELDQSFDHYDQNPQPRMINQIKEGLPIYLGYFGYQNVKTMRK